MSEDRATREPHPMRWVLWVVAALVVYALSIGPVAGLTARHWPSAIGWKVIDTIYHPMVWACGETSAKKWLVNYEVWWEEMAVGKTSGTIMRRRPGVGEMAFVRETFTDQTVVDWAGQ